LLRQVDVHDAAKQGNMAELELVAEYAPGRINETTSFRGETPLHRAARYDQEAAVSFLLNARANVNQTTKNGSTALSYASNARVRQLLIDAGGH
jgi:ankyrin repeat protein